MKYRGLVRLSRRKFVRPHRSRNMAVLQGKDWAFFFQAPNPSFKRTRLRRSA